MATSVPNRTPSKHKPPPRGVPASSQRYLDVAQVRDGVVVMRDGSYRAVVLVNAINFALKSDDEQNAIIYSYQSFLNSFNFPIQIVMQSRQLDLANYIKKLEDQLAESTNELIQIQITDYIEFIGRLIQIANIMDKKFYVVVPFNPPVTYQRGIFDKLFHPGNRLEVKMSPAEFKAYRQELLERAKTIMGGLAGMGLRTALLGTQETIELLYATYNPEEATKERLTNIENITGSYVHPTASKQETVNSEQEIQANAAATPNPLTEVAPAAAEAGKPFDQAQGKPAETATPSPIPAPTPPPAPIRVPINSPATNPVAAQPATMPEPTPAEPTEAAIPAVLPTNDLSLPTSLPSVSGPIDSKPIDQAQGEQETVNSEPITQATAQQEDATIHGEPFDQAQGEPQPLVAAATPGIGTAIPSTTQSPIPPAHNS